MRSRRGLWLSPDEDRRGRRQWRGQLDSRRRHSAHQMAPSSFEGLILLLRATYLLPTEYKGGFRRYDVIDLTQNLSTVAIAESEFPNLRAGL